MHDIKWIREEPQGLIGALVRRGTDKGEAEKLIGKLIKLDEERRAGIASLESWQAQRNALSKEVGAAKKAKDEAKAEELMAAVTKMKTDISNFEHEVQMAEFDLQEELAAIPNVPLPEVPEGADEHGNVEFDPKPHADIEASSLPMPALRNYAFAPAQHFEIGEALGQMDFEAAAKLSGARFVVLKSRLARLERAIGQFFINTHVEEHGLTEVAPPVLVKDEAMFGTAQLPKFEDDQFFGTDITVIKSTEQIFKIAFHEGYASKWRNSIIEKLDSNNKSDIQIKSIVFSGISSLYSSLLRHGFDKSVADGAYDRAIEKLDLHHDLISFRKPQAEKVTERRWLIPTAEVPLTNLVAQSIVAEEELPMRLTALTPCFRAEAGSAGRDTRGMIRQHQFNKVEMVSITTPEQSPDEHERMLACAQAVLKKLDLPHRVMTLCTGDMGFASAKTYDIEVWLPGQNAYREISSVSTCTDFQARRMNARYRPAGAKQARFLHTLNGSGVAVGRAMVAILETYQNEDGSVTVPDVLVPYMGGVTRIEKA